MRRPVVNLGDPIPPCGCHGAGPIGSGIMGFCQGACTNPGSYCGWAQNWSWSGNVYDWVWDGCDNYNFVPPGLPRPRGERHIVAQTKRRGGSIRKRYRRGGSTKSCPDGSTAIDEFGNNIC